MKLRFSVYRYDPDVNDAPCMQDYTLEAEEGRDMMLLGALTQLEEKDPSLSFHRSYHEGVYGSDGLSMDGRNGLTCTTPISALNQPGKKIAIRLLLGLSVVRDLVVDMGQFYAQHERVRPCLLNNGKNLPAREHLQMPEQREKLDGLYECISYTYCSTFCPLSWWNPDKFIDPAGLLITYRLSIGSRDTETDSRPKGLSDAFNVFHRHSIMNCVSVYPEGLSLTRAIDRIKLILFRRSA